MTQDKGKKRDLGLMVVAGGIILIGIIGVFFDRTFGGITLTVGIGFLVVGYLSKTPEKIA